MLDHLYDAITASTGSRPYCAQDGPDGWWGCYLAARPDGPDGIDLIGAGRTEELALIDGLETVIGWECWLEGIAEDRARAAQEGM